MATGELLILYTRAECHLCERAEAMLREAGLCWRAVDIGGSAELERAYGLRVPVLKRSDTGLELDFPFDRAGVTSFAGQ
jgi:hypothetical protein